MAVRRDYQIVRGDDVRKVIRRGRAVYDAVLTAGDATVTSEAADFADATDAGALVLGVGIPEGTTVATVTNGTTIELSAAPTISGVLSRRQVVPGYPQLHGFVVLARDLSGWTFASKIRKGFQSETDLGAAEVDDDDAVTGRLEWVCPNTLTDDLPWESWYDIQGTRTSDGFVETFQHGKLTASPDATR